MKERGILFKGRLVRSILYGWKTETRRIMKPQPDHDFGFDTWSFGDGHSGRGWYSHCGEYPDEGAQGPWKCPYGVDGDRLYVREAWAICENLNDNPELVYRSDRRSTYFENSGDGETIIPTGDAFYLASDFEPDKWRPSIHMPRWASRIDLDILSVHPERLQEITPAGARAEGVSGLVQEGQPDATDGAVGEVIVNRFRKLWDSTAEPEFSWDKNPTVWVIKFRTIHIKYQARPVSPVTGVGA